MVLVCRRPCDPRGEGKSKTEQAKAWEYDGLHNSQTSERGFPSKRRSRRIATFSGPLYCFRGFRDIPFSSCYTDSRAGKLRLLDGQNSGGRFAMALAATIVLCYVTMGQVPAAPVALTEQGWTVSADGEKMVLTVRHERIGSLLEDLQLQLRARRGWCGRENGPCQPRRISCRLSRKTPTHGGSWSRRGMC